MTQTDMDRHADDRDRKRRARERNARMRGRRSVFEIGKAIAKRAREATVQQGTQTGKRRKRRKRKDGSR